MTTSQWKDDLEPWTIAHQLRASMGYLILQLRKDIW
jgi:hypothetical protein